MSAAEEVKIDCSGALEARLQYFNELEKKYKEEEASLSSNKKDEL